jgi:epoxyqueuosine reductase QueG
MSITTNWVKDRASDLGADLCGIANVKNFSGAPEGFHPRNVLPGCQSVIVVAKRFLSSAISARSTVPYTDVRSYLIRRLDDLLVTLCYELEAAGALAVPVNAIGSTEWDAQTSKIRGILSLKHAGELAGLGRIGKNTLLVTPRFGNMIWLGAVITDAALEPDPMLQENPCPTTCRACLDACPVQALEGQGTMNQKACLEHTYEQRPSGEWRIKCFACRAACPNRLGTHAE